MPTYISLLRGINVSGQKMIKMTELKASFERLEFFNVRTYIQSGNVIFESDDTNISELERKSEAKIKEDFGFDVSVIVKQPSDLQEALNRNPFLKDVSKDPDKVYFIFLANEPQTERIEKLKEVDYTPEEYFIDEKNLYFYVPKAYGQSKFSNNFFESKLKIKGTSRNLKTVKKLLELSSI